MVVQFERSVYEGSEGERVEVCAVLIGTASQSVLVGVDSVDGSAAGCDSYLFHKSAVTCLACITLQLQMTMAQ